jgi:hypothetical protein
MISDYLRIERALSGILAISELNPEEASFCTRYRPAFEIGRLAGRMSEGFYAHKTAFGLARRPDAANLIADGKDPPVDYVLRKDGTHHVYDVSHYLDYACSNPQMAHELERVWINGALIAVGDALSKVEYLNRAPLLELLRHLRNGVAHGNTFNIVNPGQLTRYPAHNRAARMKADCFEITARLHGTAVLFDFMGPADILDALKSIEVYLTRIRERHAANELNSLLRL